MNRRRKIIDKYTEKNIKAIKSCTTNSELTLVINKIYIDGFEDGTNEIKED